jgi:hypothetical protein
MYEYNFKPVTLILLHGSDTIETSCRFIKSSHLLDMLIMEICLVLYMQLKSTEKNTPLFLSSNSRCDYALVLNTHSSILFLTEETI